MISHAKKFIFVHIGKNGGRSIDSVLRRYAEKFITHQHILDIIKDGSIDDYFKFAFVRNPWDRCVSRYHYVKNKSVRGKAYHNTTFRDFVFNKNDRFKLSAGFIRHSPRLVKVYEEKSPFEQQLDWISDENGKILADFIGRFENIQEDFDIVCDKIGIPREKLPHKNKSKHKHYTEYYDEETKEVVARRYVKDIEFFKYKFSQ